MRALRIAAGIAVLLNAIHLIHAIHHFTVMNAPNGAGGWSAIAAAVVLDLLSFAGGFLLLWQRG